MSAARQFDPDLFFVFKGDSVTKATLEGIQNRGATAINFYPDTGFDGCTDQSIGTYDWVFTTKPAHIDYLKEFYHYTRATFVSHAFDASMHVPLSLSERDQARYECDAVFIGNFSEKKQQLLNPVIAELGDITFKIWGQAGWRRAEAPARDVYQSTPVWGQEYAKAINGARINLGLLFEGTRNAPAGDVITARTFEVPAAGGFMLHERTEEAMHYFEEDKECAFFEGADELIKKIRSFLAHEDERKAIATAGRQRALTSGYSYDDRVATVVAKYHEIRATKAM